MPPVYIYFFAARNVTFTVGPGRDTCATNCGVRYSSRSRLRRFFAPKHGSSSTTVDSRDCAAAVCGRKKQFARAILRQNIAALAPRLIHAMAPPFAAQGTRWFTRPKVCAHQSLQHSTQLVRVIAPPIEALLFLLTSPGTAFRSGPADSSLSPTTALVRTGQPVASTHRPPASKAIHIYRQG